jgi:hypothetical protein
MRDKTLVNSVDDTRLNRADLTKATETHRCAFQGW